MRLYDAIAGVLAKYPSLALDDVMDRHRITEALAHELRTGPWRAVKAEDIEVSRPRGLVGKVGDAIKKRAR